MNHTVLHIVFHVYSRLVLGHCIGVCELGLPKFPVAHLYWDAALLLASLGLPKEVAGPGPREQTLPGVGDSGISRGRVAPAVSRLSC